MVAAPALEFSFDLETFGTIDLKVAGAWAYSLHPDTDVLCAAWGDFHLQHGWQPGDPPPVFGPGVKIHGYNVRGFDAVIWHNILTPRYGWFWPGWDAFIDTMARAAYTNLPGHLDEVARALGTSPKDKEGHKLMMSLSKPIRAIKASNDPKRHHTAERLARLMEYCKQDVKAEYDVGARLPDLPAHEKLIFEADFSVNKRGVHINQPLVHASIACAEGIADHQRRLLKELTGRKVESETDLNGLASWCRDQGLNVPEGKGAMDKAAIETYLDMPTCPEHVKKALRIRQFLGRSSLSKLARMLAALCPDGRIRGIHQYYGAHQTGRWAGRIIQGQNFPRTPLPDYDQAIAAAIEDGPEAFLFYYGDDAMDVLTGLLRPCINAAPGHELVIGDYNAIEARVVAWLAGETTLLDAFRSGKCPYKLMASVVFGVPYAEITKAQRALGKVIILACGYGMGAEKFQATAARAPYYIDLTLERATELVNIYRRTNTRIQQLWYAADDAAKSAIRNPGTIYEAGRLMFKFDGVDLKMRLPNGSILWYRRAYIGDKLNTKTGKMMPAIYFYGEDEHGRFSLQNTYGGKLVENASQAVSRGVTADALVRCEVRGLCPVLTVHDEIGCELPVGRLSPHALEAVMCEPEPWSESLPVKVEAFSSPYYRK